LLYRTDLEKAGYKRMFIESETKKKCEGDIFARAFGRKLNLVIGDQGVPEEDIFSPLAKNKIRLSDSHLKLVIEIKQQSEATSPSDSKDEDYNLHHLNSTEMEQVEQMEKVNSPKNVSSVLRKKYTFPSKNESVIKVPEGCILL
jgi:hypothetical protein